MSFLPRVSELTREFVARQYDDLGPEACVVEATETLARDNPELLEMIGRCAGEPGAEAGAMVGFAMFYQLLVAASADAHGRRAVHALPCVSAETRDALVREIDAAGDEAFTQRAVTHLERSNPELLQMAHGFASRRADYGLLMQGFALVYRSLELQSAADRRHLH